MSAIVEKLSASETARFKQQAPEKCKKLDSKVQSLSDYFSVIASTIRGEGAFWFRGHADVKWSLTPSALRFKSSRKRKVALGLIADFKRIAYLKLPKPPEPEKHFVWAQLAQHYGLPTRLLDWTESATIALFFACERVESDGMVFILDPVALNRLGHPQSPRIFDPNTDSGLIMKYLRLGPGRSASGRYPMAVNPVWNSDRLMLQKGVFTLHGAHFDLDGMDIPSLVALPILREFKAKLRKELERVGVDEMTIFPELEHSCSHLKRNLGTEE